MKNLPPDEIATFARDVLLNPSRTRPVVAITTHPRTGRPFVDPAEVERRLGTLADLVEIETGDATWALTDALPDRLDVFGGAMRVWWPGLSAESDPYQHRLYLMFDEAQGAVALARLEDELRRRTLPPEESAVTVVVDSLAGGIAVREPGGASGRVVQADLPLAAIAACLRPELKLKAAVLRTRGDGSREYSLSGLLPGPWSLIGDHLESGDVVLGRVFSIRDKDGFALVELLPGARGIVHVSEVDWTFVRNVSDELSVGEVVPVEILDLAPDGKRAQLSVKRPLTASREPRPSPSLVPGGLPFDWRALEAGAEEDDRESAGDEDLLEERDALRDELRALSEDRAAMRRQVMQLKDELKSARDRMAALERRVAPRLDPLSSERAFLLAVRTAYAELDEGDRFAYPLQRMRVGPRFLETVRALAGVETEKVVEVAMQVACDLARTIAGREVHPLRASDGGRQRTRARDGAQAWRCALQVGTPGARRMHWWRIPEPEGAVVEFASVGHHDETEIPE